MTWYDQQLLCAKRCGKIYTINFLGNWFLLGCNHSLANSLLHYELKCLGWIGVWWWWFGVVWVILISLMRMDWCGYNLVSNPFSGLAGTGRLSMEGKGDKLCSCQKVWWQVARTSSYRRVPFVSKGFNSVATHIKNNKTKTLLPQSNSKRLAHHQ